MPLNSNFFTEFTSKNVKIGQYSAKIWTKCNSLFFGYPVYLWRTTTEHKILMSQKYINNIPIILPVLSCLI